MGAWVIPETDNTLLGNDIEGGWDHKFLFAVTVFVPFDALKGKGWETAMGIADFHLRIILGLELKGDAWL